MDGGVWQRLLHFGVMQTYPVLHAVAKSGLIRVVDASERRFSALAAWRLPRWLGSHLPAGRVCDCRTIWGWLKALPLRTPRGTHGTMPQS